VGDCYASHGQFAEARPWFERAVGAKGRLKTAIGPLPRGSFRETT
jgi:hypothetical protein